MDDHPTILFDGVCNFCNGAVNFAIKRDKNKTLKFAPLQSEAGQRLLRQFNLSTTQFNSFVFIEKGIVYTQSTAALKIAKHLNGLWKLGYIFIIVPSFIRNGFYKIVAKYRYKLFGQKDQCMVPTEEMKARFL